MKGAVTVPVVALTVKSDTASTAVDAMDVYILYVAIALERMA